MKARGNAVDLSDDGNVLAVGAPGNDGAGSNSGRVRIYTWSGSAWVQSGNHCTIEFHAVAKHVVDQVRVAGNCTYTHNYKHIRVHTRKNKLRAHLKQCSVTGRE